MNNNNQNNQNNNYQRTNNVHNNVVPQNMRPQSQAAYRKINENLKVKMIKLDKICMLNLCFLFYYHQNREGPNNYQNPRIPPINTQNSQHVDNFRDRSPLDAHRNQQFSFPQRSTSVAPSQQPIGAERQFPINQVRQFNDNFRSNSVQPQNFQNTNQQFNQNIQANHHLTHQNFQSQQNNFQIPTNPFYSQNSQNSQHSTNFSQVQNRPERMQTESTMENQEQNQLENGNTSFEMTACSESTFGTQVDLTDLNDSYYLVSSSQRKRLKASSTPVGSRYNNSNDGYRHQNQNPRNHFHRIAPFLTRQEKSEKENKKKWKEQHQKLSVEVENLKQRIQTMHEETTSEIESKYNSILEQINREKQSLIAKLQVEANDKLATISSIESISKDISRTKSWNIDNYDEINKKIRNIKIGGGIGYAFLPRRNGHDGIGELKLKPFAGNCRVILPDIFYEKEIFIDGDILEIEVEANDIDNKPISNDLMDHIKDQIGFRAYVLMIDKRYKNWIDYSDKSEDVTPLWNHAMVKKRSNDGKSLYRKIL